MITKKSELKFLNKLASYSKNVRQKDIHQAQEFMEYYDNCECFGAHVAKCCDERSYFYDQNEKEYYYDYQDGKRVFREHITPNTLKLFLKYGACPKEDEYPNIFSSAEWIEHPYEVITKVINHLTNQQKEEEK